MTTLKPHQAILLPNGLVIPKPRFRTSKHRGQQAGAFGGSPYLKNARIQRLIKERDRRAKKGLAV